MGLRYVRDFGYQAANQRAGYVLYRDSESSAFSAAWLVSLHSAGRIYSTFSNSVKPGLSLYTDVSVATLARWLALSLSLLSFFS